MAINKNTGNSRMVRQQTASLSFPKDKKQGWRILLTLVVVLVFAGILSFSYWRHKKQETVIHTAAITSVQGKIVRISPENDSFDIEINLLVRHEKGVPIYELHTKKINVRADAQTFNPEGPITKDEFFQAAEVGDVVYIAGNDILQGQALEPYLLIIDFDQLVEE